MKNYIFVFLFLSLNTLHAESFLLKNFSLELTAKTGFSYDNTAEKDIEKTTFDDITSGFKLITPITDIRFYKKEDSFISGFSLFSSNFSKKVPIIIKIGNLSKSGGISKLKNPLLSASVSSFSSASTNTSAITSYLPSYSSFSNPFASFASVSIKDIYFIKKLYLNIFREEDQTTTFSAGTDISLSKSVKFSLNSVFGTFPYEENDSSYWFSTKKYYPQGEHFCMMNQFAFSIPHFSTLLSVNCYESPFGYFTFTYKSENNVKFKKINIGLSAFLNQSNQTFTSSEDFLEPALQGKLNILFHTPIKIKRIVMLRVGAAGYVKLNLTQKEHDFLYSFGTQLSTDKSNFSLNVKTTNSIAVRNYLYTYIFSSIEIKAVETLYFPILNPSLSVTFTYKPQNDNDEFTTSEKIAISINRPNNPSISFSTQLNLTQKNYELTDFYSSSSLSCRFSIQRLHITLKTSLKLIFL